MNESEYQALIEASWRRPLTRTEQARLDVWLATHPDANGDWESEAQLNRLLGQLPDAPVASNFTAQVLQALDRETAAEVRRPSFSDRIQGWFRRPASRIAWAVLMAGVLWFGFQQHQASLRNEMAQGLSVLANVATLSDPAVLQDFETIQRIGHTAPPDDEELFAVLTK